MDEKKLSKTDYQIMWSQHRKMQNAPMASNTRDVDFVTPYHVTASSALFGGKTFTILPRNPRDRCRLAVKKRVFFLIETSGTMKRDKDR